MPMHELSQYAVVAATKLMSEAVNIMGINANDLHEICNFFSDLFRIASLEVFQGLGDDLLNGIAWIERTKWVLEDYLHLCSFATYFWW